MIPRLSNKLMDSICGFVEPNLSWKVKNLIFNGLCNAGQSLEN
jgi:hypothetical protein